MAKQKSKSAGKPSGTAQVTRLSYAAGEPVAGLLHQDGSLAQLLINAAANPERGIVFIQDDETEIRLSYADVLERAETRLAGLRAAGIVPGAPVLLVFNGSIDFVVTFWACMLGGIVAVPLSYPTSFVQANNPLTKLQGIWEQLDKPPVLSEKRFAERLGELEALLGISGMTVLSPEMLDAHGTGAQHTPGTGDALAFIQYSSGSTGKPKGVMLTHRNLLTNLEAIIFHMEIKPGESFLSWTPYSHDMGLIGFHLTPVAAQTDQYNISPFKFAQRPMIWLEKMAQHGAAFTGSPNFGYRLLLSKIRDTQLETLDLRRLRLIFNGAEPIAVPVMRQFMESLAPCGLDPSAMFPVYGMAEACLSVSFPPIGSLPLVHAVERRLLAAGGQLETGGETDETLLIVDEGNVLRSCEMRIVDADDNIVAEGLIGHVQICGANVTKGYYNNPDANRETFVDGWLRTGDLGFMLNARLSITGRAKDIIFVNGQKFFAHDIEFRAEEIKGVQASRVVACGFHDAALGREQVVVFVAVRRPAGSTLTVPQILAQLWSHINAAFAIPVDFIVQVKSVPRTTSGKLQRFQLLSAFRDGDFSDSTFTAEQLLDEAGRMTAEETGLTTTQERIRRVWAEVLQRMPEQLPIDQPFLTLGGTSLKAVQILGMLEKEFATELTHEFLLQCRTIGEMADFIERPVNVQQYAETQTDAGKSAPLAHGGEDIAIISMACRFPGANTPEAFWENLVGGRDSITEVPLDRWNADLYYQAGKSEPGKINSRWGGFIDDAFAFDAEFFQIDGGEATAMDPQQRLFLQTSWQVMERAGYSGARSDGRRIGVFAGASHNTYLEYHVHALDLLRLQRFESFGTLSQHQQDALVAEWKERFGASELHANTAVNNLLNMIAARTSHMLNLKGPSLTVDTACSSSLVAVHLACDSIRRGECDMAIAGGINLNLTPTPYQLFARAGTLSPSGRCKVFDASADGFVPGEGVGAVLLKSLSRALADGDQVLGVIKRSVVNNDGRSLGVMAPNPDGQRIAIADTYRDGVISPGDIQYVEAHGTGTAIGDPSEVRALALAFSESGAHKTDCAIGSVKANIGHLLSAAGIAGLIKVVLALQHRQMPPSVHITLPNPLINFPDTPFLLLGETKTWTAPENSPRRAAINSFGFGGTNCHMVLEESPQPVVSSAAEVARPLHLLCLSARSETAARCRATELAAFLRRTPGISLADVCYSQHTGRRHFAHRLAVAADSAESLAEKLEQIEHIVALPALIEPGVALMFTGQGAQYPGMARSLYQTLPSFRRIVDECAACFDPYLDKPLLACLYDHDSDDSLLAQTNITQPAIFTIDYALGRLMLDWGVRPACMLGHSVGEYVAACLAGVMSLADAAKIVAARGRLMHALPAGGGMAAVFASRDELQPLLTPFNGRLWFAAHNGSHQVISGELEALTQFQAQLQALGKNCRQLQVSHAFHTPLLEPMLDAFSQVLAEVEFSAPCIPLVSNMNAQWITSTPLDATYWRAHVLAPVCFEQSVQHVAEKGISIFIECGPDKILSNLTRTLLNGRAVHVLSALDRRREDWDCLLSGMGTLYCQGVNLDWEAYDADFDTHRITLPTYPFERNIYRLATGSAEQFSAPAPAPAAMPSRLATALAVEMPRPAASALVWNWSETVQTIVAEFLRIAPAQVDMFRNFHDLGLDSAAAVQLAERLGASAQQKLPPTLLFEYQTPAALADYLRDQVRPVEAAAPAWTAQSAPRTALRFDAPKPATQQFREHDIAIIGIACRIPGANTPEEYWNMLIEGRSAIGEVPVDRWSVQDYFGVDSKATHLSYSKWGAFIERPYDFDPLFFGVSPREAQVMDPQQRLFMEVAWESLQQAGYGGEFRTREIGIFVGCEQNHYAEHFIMHQRYQALHSRLSQAPWFAELAQGAREAMLQNLQEVLLPAELTSDAVAGNGMNEIAARISHWLDLRGPSLVVNTACSSSLVALHLACESLRTGESKMAIAGGVYLTGNDTPFVFLSRVGALSPTGACAPFDQRANGMVLGEGVSAVILKPLKDAVRDGDYIHGVVKGSAINNDGHSNGLIAPNPRGQADAMRKAYHNAGVTPESISYIECHGTGTPLGDPVEFDGMTQAFRKFTDRKQFCGIGSVKSSIGHMLSGSSLPSLIKVVMAMHHRMIPVTVGFDTPNPHIDFAQSPFYVVAGAPQPWLPSEKPLRAGINSFGFGGTNCHVVLEQAPDLHEERTPTEAIGSNLLMLTGRTQKVLQEVATRLAAYLVRHPEVEPAQVCATMNSGQRDLPFKASFIVRERGDLLALLDAVAVGRAENSIVQGRSNPKQTPRFYLALDGVSPMNGEDVDMLIERFPQLQQLCDLCKEHYSRAIAQSNTLTQHHLDDLLYAFAVQYALGRLLMAAEIEPAAVVAEGTGVLVGACLLGVLSIKQAAEMLSRYALGQREMAVTPEFDGERQESWNCPLVIPGAVLHSNQEGAAVQLEGYLQLPRELVVADMRDLGRNDFVIVHVGGSPQMRAQLDIPAELNWIDLNRVGGAVERLLTVFGQLYVRGIRFNSRPLVACGVRRVPLPTYPFENKAYRFNTPLLAPQPDASAPLRTPHPVFAAPTQTQDIRVALPQQPAPLRTFATVVANDSKLTRLAPAGSASLSAAEREQIALALQRELNPATHS
jgi:acyl transferase domain-containing protein/acyl-CoA synthetase (AMP-forming)/AMP-acid ligase II